MARSPRTAPPLRDSCETVTITLPIHPLCGLALPLVREVERSGGRYFEAEHPGGWRIWIPRWWTACAVSCGPARAPSGEFIRVSVDSLLALTFTIEAISRESIDVPTVWADAADPRDLHPPVIDAASPAAVPPVPSPLGGAVAAGAQRCRGGLGNAGSGCCLPERDSNHGGKR